METGAVIAIIGLAITVGTLVFKSGRDRAAIDLSISEALRKVEMAIEIGMRKAKHDAINQVSRGIADVADTKVSTERYEADQVGIERRLTVLERDAGLDGTGPHRRGTRPGE